MAKKIVTVTFEFEETLEDAATEDAWLHYVFQRATATSDIPDEGRRQISETWAQSDRYWVDICSDLLTVVEGAEEVPHG